MRMTLKIFGSLFLLAVLAFGGLVTYWLTSDASQWQNKLAAAASEQLQRQLTLGGTLQPTFSLANGFGLRVTAVALGNANGFQPQQMLQIDELELVIDVLAALRHEIHVKKLVLRGAAVTLEARGERNNWTFAGSGGSSAPATAGETPQQSNMRFAADQVLIENLALTHINNGARKEYKVQRLLLTAAASAPLTLQLNASVDGEALTLDAAAGTLAELQDGQKQPVKINLVYGPHQLQFTAAYRRTGAEHHASDVQLNYQGMQAGGMLVVNLAGRVPMIMADFKIPQLDLATFAVESSAGGSAPAAAPTKQGLFSPNPLPWESLQTLNADLVFDIKQLNKGAVAYGPVNLQAKLQGGNLGATVVAQPPAATRPITARVQAAASQTLNLKLDAPALDPATLATWLGQAEPLVQAPAQLQLEVAGRGASVQQIMAGANGNFKLAFAPGKLNADALPTALTAILGTMIGGDKLQNATLGCLQADVPIQNGVAQVRALGADASIFGASGAGVINLREESINLNLVLDATSAISQLPLLPVAIKGNLQQPTVSADAKALTGQVLNKVVDNVAAKTIVGQFGSLAQAVTGSKAQAVEKPFNPCRPQEKPSAPATAPPAATQAQPNPVQQQAQELLQNPAAAKELLQDPSKLLNLFGE